MCVMCGGGYRKQWQSGGAIIMQEGKKKERKKERSKQTIIGVSVLHYFKAETPKLQVLCHSRLLSSLLVMIYGVVAYNSLF